MPVPLRSLLFSILLSAFLIGSVQDSVAQESDAPTVRRRAPEARDDRGRGEASPRAERQNGDDARDSAQSPNDSNQNNDRSARDAVRTERGRDRVENNSKRVDRGRSNRERSRDLDDHKGSRDRDDFRRDRRPSYRGPAHGHSRREVRVRPRIHIDISWPWEHRHARKWSPRYRYRQVVHVDAGWGHGHRRSDIDVRTVYRQRVRSATGRRALVDVIIDRIEVYADGRFVGEVDRIPEDLARVRGTVHRGGGIMFDRDLFIVGDPHVGFEIISTRHYDDFVLNGYRRSHGYRAGVLDFRRERVLKIRHSRFFDPFDFTGFVPIDLLPRDREWIGDYGYGAPSRHWYGDDDRTYYGYLDDVDDFDRIGGDRAQYEEVPPGVRGAVRLPEVDPLERSDDESFRTESGAEIRVKREATLERVD